MKNIIVRNLSRLKSGIYVCTDGMFDVMMIPLPFMFISLWNNDVNSASNDEKNFVRTYKNQVLLYSGYRMEYLEYFWNFDREKLRVNIYGKSSSKEVNEFMYHVGKFKTHSPIVQILEFSR